LSSTYKCVLVGGAKKQTSYIDRLKSQQDKNPHIICPGFIYDKETLGIIMQNALCYIHGNSVGGTNPALLQAMAAGRPVLAIDCIFNRETLENGGYFFDRNELDLSAKMKKIIENIDEASEKAVYASKRVASFYNWDIVTDQYNDLFEKITSGV
jgi:glycosyltransferase involved in cell wall biosynthesis